MERQFSQVGIGVRGIESFERLAHTSMQLQAAPRRKVVVDGLTDQRMCEAHAPRLPWNARHDAVARCLIERVEEMIAADLAYLLERVEIELTPEHGREDEDQLAIL